MGAGLPSLPMSPLGEGPAISQPRGGPWGPASRPSALARGSALPCSGEDPSVGRTRAPGSLTRCPLPRQLLSLHEGRSAPMEQSPGPPGVPLVAWALHPNTQ